MEEERWQPVPVPRGDGRHDIGDDARAAIVERLQSDWSRDPDLTPEKVRHLAMWAGASVRALLHELGTLRDLADPPTRPPVDPPRPFSELREQMSPEAQGRAKERADRLLSEMPADPIVDRQATEVQPGLYVSTKPSTSVFAPARRSQAPADRQGPVADSFARLDLPIDVSDALERVQSLVSSEAGHIAYLDDGLDDLVGAARTFGRGEGQVAQPALAALVARWEVRKIHMAFNVAVRRTGADYMPAACDGPDCKVCAELEALLEAK